MAPPVAAQADATAGTSTRRYYVLALLTIVYALNFLDRTIFNVLIEPIKKEFVLGDTTMGLLAGSAPLWPQARQTKRGSRWDNRTSSGHLVAVISHAPMIPPI